MPSPKPPSSAASLPIIAALHSAVERATVPLEREHAQRLECGEGCSKCCVDELTVFEVEATHLRQHYPDLLREGIPHPSGACSFLDTNGSCRVYEHRPYVCRTQGLPLRWLDLTEDDEVVEYRDICELNDAGPPIEELEPASCWTLGVVEEKLSALQNEMTPGEMRRVSLRSLFENESEPAS